MRAIVSRKRPAAWFCLVIPGRRLAEQNPEKRSGILNSRSYLTRRMSAPESDQTALLREIATLERRLSALERSILFRASRKAGIATHFLKRSAGKALLATPLRNMVAARFRARQQAQYAPWFEAHQRADCLSGKQVSLAQAQISFSIILPTQSPHPERFRLAVESVRSQTWPNWQLCVSLNGEIPAASGSWLNDLAKTDDRIAVSADAPAGISATLNRGIAIARGEFLMFLGHDDLLEPTALAHVAETLARQPVDLIYTDEDVIDEAGVPLKPNFKPGWSPELLRGHMYMGHLLAARRNAVLAAGGFDSAFDGSQDFDLVLRLIDQGARVAHIPRVLYHSRAEEDSISPSRDATETGKRALESSFRRRGIVAEVDHSDRPNTFRARIRSASRTVSLIIPSRSPIYLERCLRSLRAKTSVTEPFELIVVHHKSDRTTDTEMQRISKEHHALVVSYTGPFDFARMMNDGASAATGELLVSLNDDVEPRTAEWLSHLTGPFAQADIGVTGARLLYPNGAIQHAGVVLGIGDAVGHAGRFLFDSTWWPWINNTRDVSAVTGACLATTKRLFDSLNGFDLRFPNNYNDVDYCLRAREAGFRVVLVNDAVLVHHEGLTRGGGTTTAERLEFFRRWGRLLDQGDPFFSPHLNKDREDLSLEGTP